MNGYDVLKYGATGVTSPDMTAYDKMRAIAMAGGAKYPVATITGIPPISFKSDGRPLSACTIAGNAVQDGEQTPDFVGKRTENLSNQNYVYRGLNWSDGTISNIITPTRLTTMDFSDITSGQITVSVYDINSNSYDGVLLEYDSSGNYTGNYPAWHALPYTWSVGSNTKVRICVKRSDDDDIDDSTKIMLNTGSTAKPYEPYGCKIPITCAGQTTTIYIGDPLRKAIDGSDAVDILSSTGTITRAVDADGNALETPTTQIIDVPPEIPTVRGSNTLTVDTTVQPSSVSITGHIKTV